MICRLYGLHQIEEQAGAFLKYGYFQPSEMDLIETAVNELCAELRKVAVPVVDSFALSDHIIVSPSSRPRSREGLVRPPSDPSPPSPLSRL